MNALSNPYSAEILNAVSARITPNRLLIAHEWVHTRLQEYGADALGAEAQSLIGSPAERGWLASHGTLLDAIRRIHDQSAESVFALQRPARWFVRSLWWALAEPGLSQEWLDGGLLRYEPSEFEVLAKALFSPNSPSLAVLLEHLSATDPVEDRMSLLGGMQWSLAMLTVWAPVLLSSLDHPDRLSEQGPPRDLCVAMLGDLRSDLLGDGRMESFRSIARRRQERARAEQEGVAPVGEDEEAIPDIDLEAGVKEVVQRAEHDGKGDADGRS